MDRSLHKPYFPSFYLPTLSIPIFSPTIPVPRRSLRRLRNPHFKISVRAEASGGAGGGACAMPEVAFLGNSDSDLPVELCLTETLPPALTLEEGGRRIKEAVEKMKANPPGSRSGIVRLQVAVPPSVKSLSWLLSQPHSSVGYPQFYMSGELVEGPTSELVALDGMCGVSGLGSAIYFTGPSRSGRNNLSSIKRYLCVDSSLIRAYGFIGIRYDVESSAVKCEADSCIFFIPQIELDEFESMSILAATIAWDDCLYYTFENAVQYLQLSLYKAVYHVWPIGQIFYNRWIMDVCEKSALMEVKNTRLVLLTANNMAERNIILNFRHLGNVPTLHFYFMLSRSVAFTTKMGCLRGPKALEKCQNVNALWASLIVEECIRLGLTYFCIAPGSRSSLLAIAASAHPLTTCVSCYDERSLAFHAIGHVRGSGMAAAVITSSGTAVSNLHPAVVEASQDFLPLLLLTADRPPELQDAGANQSINQVNHFGSSVRFFFNLPPPTVEIPARMVLTTVDSAVHIAMQAPKGPVHINCPFREPLENTMKEWSLDCLHGLNLWMSNLEPFTKYIRAQYYHSSNVILSQIASILEIIQGANHGLLLIGALHNEDEIWAALLVAKHLSWPIVADILSGLRLRKALTLLPEIEESLLFIDHLDHLLLTEGIHKWVQPDVVLQIGGKITSKRIARMLETSLMCSYVMVDNHPYRHDPSHIVTHRIQSSINEFAHYILMLHSPRKIQNWASTLQILNMMIAWEISFQIQCQISLTEPHVAQVLSTVLPHDAALFVGNSMAIRDLDMYGHGWLNSSADTSSVAYSGVNCLGMRVVGNRGASGIDGLLSTAIGFATGCTKRVFCILGDISLLHDTNGLSILGQRVGRKPMTVIVINNHGGAIFSLLPVANLTRSSILEKYFYTTHTISLNSLCKAHSVKHVCVHTKMELQQALRISLQANTDYIIEVESCIEDNATFHRTVTKYASQAANHALQVLSCFAASVHDSGGASIYKIDKIEYFLYRLQLGAPPTSAKVADCASVYKDGFILMVALNNGCVGLGEVAPIEIHKEDLVDVEEQLRFLLNVIKLAELPNYLPLLKGSFSHWIWRNLGIPPSSLFPSVRCGLEMAILNALAATRGLCLADVILGSKSISSEISAVEQSVAANKSRVPICALVDSSGSPEVVARFVSQLVDEGFTTIKMKVARRGHPLEDVAVIKEIRQTIGYAVEVRVDANQRWTYDEAIQFGFNVKPYNLQYIEEPVQIEADILRFCDETGIPVALDETLDNFQGNLLDKLQEFLHPGIVAIVIKPSVLGGFENALSIARWAHQHDKLAVISSAFESSISLATYVQFAYCIDQQQCTKICSVDNKEYAPVVAHGLGTYRWLREDVINAQLNICVHSHHNSMAASVADAAQLLHRCQIIHERVQTSYSDKPLQSYRVVASCENFCCSLNVHDTGVDVDNRLIVFLHGFLGTGEDWIPVMKALSATSRCIAIDLPGHGQSKIERHVEQCNQELNMSIEMISIVLCKVIRRYMPQRIILVGYSMGARIALYMALRGNFPIDGAVVISGSPGLRDERICGARISQDDAKAQYLLRHGLECFLDMWYAGEMWDSLKRHPNFTQIICSRTKHSDINGLALAMSGLSIGRQPSLWEDLKATTMPLLFIVGEKDGKFHDIAWEMCREISSCSQREYDCMKMNEMVRVIPDSGHAVHLENPLPLINAVRKFFNSLL